MKELVQVQGPISLFGSACYNLTMGVIWCLLQPHHGGDMAAAHTLVLTAAMQGDSYPPMAQSHHHRRHHQHQQTSVEPPGSPSCEWGPITRRNGDCLVWAALDGLPWLSGCPHACTHMTYAIQLPSPDPMPHHPIISVPGLLAGKSPAATP